VLLRLLGRLVGSGKAPADAALGLERWRTGDLDGAEAALRVALKNNAADPQALYGLGAVLVAQQRMDEGLEALRQAVEARPREATYRVALGNALAQGRLTAEALEHLEAAVELAPDKPELEARLHKPLLDLCDWDRVDAAIERLRGAAQSEPPERWTLRAHPWVVLALPLENRLRQEVLRQHARRVAARAANLQPLRRKVREAGLRLRLAYVSADFRSHPVGQLAAGLYEHHDRQRFELFAYSMLGDDGSVHRKRLRAAFEHFVDVEDLEAHALAQRLIDDGIDILVDLAGYTGKTLTEAFALRPAPVQVNYLGYPSPMQAPFIDYLVADPIIVPAAEFDAIAEAVVHLPPSYQANDDRQVSAPQTPTREAAGLPASGFVFCCFNQTYKIERDLFAAWMRLLAAVPGSVLWLLASNAQAEANLRAAAAAHGIDPARVLFARWARRPEHLARTRLADLFLDTHTCNGHTTSSDALWAGVPLLTWPGDAFAGRVAASLLTAIGLPELIAPTLADYERLALELARDASRLRALRERLSANRQTHPLFQTQAYTRRLERVYAQMWARYRSGEKPRHFAVD